MELFSSVLLSAVRTPHVLGTVTTTKNSVTPRHQAAEVDSVNKKIVVKFTKKMLLTKRRFQRKNGKWLNWETTFPGTACVQRYIGC
jgi:hypothetical protein